MGKVDQVIDDQLIVGLHVHISWRQRPCGIVEPGQIGDSRCVSARCLAHPDPGHAPFLGYRVAAHGRAGRDSLLPWDFDTATATIEFQAVVAALQMLAHYLAQRKRRGPMTAPVLERHQLSVRQPEKRHRLFQERSSDGLAGEVFRPANGVPSVSHVHNGLQRRLRLSQIYAPIPSGVQSTTLARVAGYTDEHGAALRGRWRDGLRSRYTARAKVASELVS